ncbi:oligopeptide transporter [Moniliophthora roreri MCA 2997]|uniref:Oligopeptide transporter n=1 Tax=Moniliophthora roreri (strain MCA 2997) TaxID=1381753 RepID=V2W987_MONRO|nr:oligopeptide transporter [Moniliophthora roreri MCA 2997]
MATLPTLQHEAKPPVYDEKDAKGPRHSDSFTDEKVQQTGPLDEVEEVYADGPRLIDLGEDGKERPIVSDADYATRLVSLDDDPDMPIFTFRLWLLGLGLSCFGAVLGQIFYFRPQTIDVSILFLQIISWILGRALEEVLPGPNPSARFRTSDNAFWRFLNPGPFSLKEHVGITIMSSTASASAKAISIFAAQDLYYNVRPNAGVGIFTLISTQLIGYGMAGILRKWLVYPTFAVYPQVIPTVQLFDALHRGHEAIGQKKRLKFFWIVFIAIFIWEWFPEYIAPTLTGISIFCLANQKNAWFTRIFGGAAGNEGLGTFSICLDWAYVGSGGGSLGALFTPLSTQLSLYAGCAVCMIAFCATYASNTWNAQNFPFLTQLLFFENGTEYDQLAILNDKLELDYEKLERVGLPWYAASQLLFKISRTMYIGAAITHFIIWHGPTMWAILKDRTVWECTDPHYLKMKVYKEVNHWIYIGLFVVCACIGIGTSYAASSGLPWWALIVALIFAWVFVPVIGTLNATVGYAPSVEIMIQMIGGAVVPGKPVANMYFSAYGYNPVIQSYKLMQDLKIGQYTKLPPRATFAMQMIGTIIGTLSRGLLNYVIMATVISSHREILRAVQGSNVWSGQQVQSFNSAAVAWGALGKPLYATGTRYGFVPYMLLAGLGFPLPFWLLHKMYPKFGFNLVFTPILVAELGYLSVGINSSIFSTFLLAVFSQYYLRKYRATWFRKYNFLMSAALDGGTSIMIFIWTFAVGGASGVERPFPHWALNPKGNPDYCLRLED